MPRHRTLKVESCDRNYLTLVCTQVNFQVNFQVTFQVTLSASDIASDSVNDSADQVTLRFGRFFDTYKRLCELR